MSKDKKPSFLSRFQRKDTPVPPQKVEPSVQEKAGFQATASEDALAKAMLIKKDMTEDEKDIFLREHKEAAAKQNSADNNPNPQPAEDPRREEERRRRLGGESNTTKIPLSDRLKNGLKKLMTLPALIGGGLLGSGLLYKKSKAFRFLVKAATFPFWAYPLYSWKAAKSIVMKGPGGVGRLLKNGSVSAMFLAKTLLWTTAKLGAFAFLGVVGMKTMIDTSQGRGRGMIDNGLNALYTTFNQTVGILGGGSRWLLPKAETGYDIAKGAVVSGANSVDDVIATGSDKVTGAKNTVSECIDKAEDCSEEAGNTILNTAGKLAAGGTKLWTKGYGLSIKHFYTTLPAFLWDNIACSAFNCASDTRTPPATETPAPAAQKSAIPGDEADKLKGLLSGKETTPPLPAPARTEKEAAPVAQNPLANLSYVQTGSRYVSVCTLKALGLADTAKIGKHIEDVGKVVHAMKSDPTSPLYKAVTANNTHHVQIIASLFNSGAATADIQAQPYRLRQLPQPASVYGAEVGYVCREYPMKEFLQGSGIGPYEIPADPVRVLK